jgi:uncharacterized protein GlcG (DUF336 family)
MKATRTFNAQSSRFNVSTRYRATNKKTEEQKMKLTLESASLIVDKALAKAREAKFRPMCVAVLDDGGHVKALKREDGASILRPNIAIGKAWGAVGMGESSRQLSERLKERPAFLGALSDMSGGKVVPVAGGVLIMDGNEIIGAVGVTGGTSDEDELCAIEGIKAAGLTHKV